MRREYKALLKTLLLTIPGIKTVRTGMPKIVDDRSQPQIVIFTPKATTEQATSNISHGRRKVVMTGRLALTDIDSGNNTDAGTLAFDDLVDAIESTLRTHAILDPSGWPVIGKRYIRTEIAEAKLAGKAEGNVLRAAVIEFDIEDFVVG